MKNAATPTDFRAAQKAAGKTTGSGVNTNTLAGIQKASEKAQQTQTQYKAPRGSTSKGSGDNKKDDNKKDDNKKDDGGKKTSELVDLTGQLQIDELQGELDSANALRNFREQQARRQLTEALGEIDRAAIDNYKYIANDYAARGMQRSGGYMQGESGAMADTTRAKTSTQQALDDFVQELGLGKIADQTSFNNAKARILNDFINRRLQGTN
jgi:hypothetical protein